MENVQGRADEQSRDAIFIASVDGTPIDVNQSFSDMFFYRLEEITKSNFAELWAEPGRLSLWQEELERKGFVRDYAWKARRKDGRIIDCLVTTSIGCTEDGTLLYQSICRDVTEQKRTQEALSENEERYRQMFQGNQAIKLLIDPDTGGIVDANPAASEFYGYGIDDLKQLKISDINTLPPEHIAEEMAKARWERRNCFLFQHKLASDEIRDVEVHASPVEVQKRTLLYSIIHDITERKRAEQALLSSDQMLRSILSTCPVGICFTREREIIWTNEALLQMFGFDNDRECKGQNTRSLYPSLEEYDRIGSILDKNLRMGRATETDVRFRRKDGSDFDALVRIKALDPDDPSKGVISAVSDISDRKRVEELLRESEASFRQLIMLAPVPLCFVNKEGVLTCFNERFSQVFGYTHEEIPTLKEWWELAFPDEDYRRWVVDTWEAAVKRATEDKSDIETIEYRVTCKNGAVRLVEISGITIEDNLLATFVDVTERKSAEARIKASLKEKEVLLREIHHRVKNNFQMMAGLLMLQADKTLDEDYQNALRETEARIRTMARVHEKLYQSEGLGAVRMDEYLAEIAEDLIGFHGRGDVRIFLRANMEPVTFDIDSAIPCGLILTELVTNAVKHAFPNRCEGAIEVGLRTILGNGYELIVRDDGVGFPEGFSIEESTSLGLRLVQAFLKRFQGEISLERDHGTAIRMRFNRD